MGVLAVAQLPHHVPSHRGPRLANQLEPVANPMARIYRHIGQRRPVGRPFNLIRPRPVPPHTNPLVRASRAGWGKLDSRTARYGDSEDRLMVRGA
jgi:hypothetical protein